jgi:hypothetical protein
MMPMVMYALDRLIIAGHESACSRRDDFVLAVFESAGIPLLDDGQRLYDLKAVKALLDAFLPAWVRQERTQLLSRLVNSYVHLSIRPVVDGDGTRSNAPWILRMKRLHSKDTRASRKWVFYVGGEDITFTSTLRATARGKARAMGCFRASKGTFYVDVKSDRPLDQELVVAVHIGRAARSLLHTFKQGSELCTFAEPWDARGEVVDGSLTVVLLVQTVPEASIPPHPLRL